MPPPVDHTRPCIAVIEDDDACRKALTRLLTSSGLDVAAYASAEAFLAAIVVHDCVLLDVALPGLSGLELEFYLREHDPELGVVFLTGSSDERRDEITRRTGRTCLRKPVDETVLLVALSRAIIPSR
jgi:FixJ family two-component response regulator